MKDKIYRHLDELPKGIVGNDMTKGCIVLEGSGWKGLYTVGVLDCLIHSIRHFFASSLIHANVDL